MRAADATADAAAITTTIIEPQSSGGDGERMVETEDPNSSNRAEALRKRLRHLERVSSSPRSHPHVHDAEDDAYDDVEEEEPSVNEEDVVVSIEAAKQRLRQMEHELTSNGKISSWNQDPGESTTSNSPRPHRTTGRRPNSRRRRTSLRRSSSSAQL
eukprot:scaffold22334_cov43-Attheya_sp.AAC.1